MNSGAARGVLALASHTHPASHSARSWHGTYFLAKF
jgi:hypothetical protein